MSDFEISYVMLPVTELLVELWQMTGLEREHFSATGAPVGQFISPRVHGSRVAGVLTARGFPVYRACARFDPDYVLPWGRWKFRRRGRKDWGRRWAFSVVADVWVHTEERHYAVRLRLSHDFSLWDRHSRMRPDVIIDSVDLIRITP